MIAAAIMISGFNSARADEPESELRVLPEKELSAHEQELFDLLAEKGYTVLPEKVNYDPELSVDPENEEIEKGEYVYQVSYDYYDQFSFTWTDSNGTTHTSKLTDRATDKKHIIALLQEVYTNPLIPGFRRDRYPDHPEVESSFKIRNDFDGAEGGKLVEGDAYKREDNAHTKREDYITVDYAPCNYGPFLTGEVKKPFNGATALLVEMSDTYYDGRGTDHQLFPPYVVDTKPFDVVEEALKYVQAVTLIPYQYYVDGSTTENPGFLFNRKATVSKCFVISKGVNRPYKAFRHRRGVAVGDGKIITLDINGNEYKEGGTVDAYEMDAGTLFFNMYEELSPSSDGPIANAYEKMNSGQIFAVDHNCSSVILQEHDVVMGSAEHHTDKYHINLLMFLPDRRFDGITNFKPGTPQDSVAKVSCYSYYAEKYRPYFFFNRIHASIKEKVIIPSGTDYTTADENTVNLEDVALVPIEWKSLYKEIVKQNTEESFTIHRMTNGEVSKEPVPWSQIVIRDIKDDNGGYTYIDKASKTPELLREVGSEAAVYVLEDNAASRAGQAVTYIIYGKRAGSGFEDVESNLVTAYLPTPNKGLTIRLDKAISEYRDKKNYYTNHLSLVHTGYSESTEKVDTVMVTTKYLDLMMPGNLRYKDILTGEMLITKVGENYKLGVVPTFKKAKLRVMRYDNVNGEMTPIMECDMTNPDKAKIEPQGVWTGDDGRRESAIRVELDFDDLTPDGEESSGRIYVAYNALLYADEEEKGSHSLRPYDANRELLGDFIDKFSVSVDRDYPTRYEYILAVVPLDAPAKILRRDVEESSDNSYLSSNAIDVTVPVRDFRVGYEGYTRDQIEADTDYNNLLAPNRPGVAMTVSNNPYVSQYIFQCATHGKELARVERYPGGVYRPYLTNNLQEEYSLQNTQAGFSGELSLLLDHELFAEDEVVMVLEFQNTGENAYANGNTYGFPVKKLPSLPKITGSDYKVFYSALNPADEDSEKFYEGNIVHFTDYMNDVDDFGFAGFAMWVKPIPKGKNEEVISEEEYIPLIHDTYMDESDHKNMLFYNFYYGTKKPNLWEGYSLKLTSPSRMYSEILNPSHVVTAYRKEGNTVSPQNARSASSNRYVVTDYSSETELVGGEGEVATDVPGIGIETPDAPVEFYNLQGIRMRGDNLPPGVYIRKQGAVTEKIIVN